MPLVITFPYSPIALQFGFITIRWYGVGYAVAFLVGLWLVGRYMRYRDIGEAAWGTLAFWSIVLGLVGARLYYDVQNGFGYYVTHPQDILAVWQGGMAYFGAIFTVPFLVFFWTRVRRLPFWTFADAAALFAAVGQPIGRLGNIVNGDILGYPSNLPWAMRYTNPQSLAPQLGVAYQPAAAYELLIGLVMLSVLLLLWRYRRPQPGALFVLYLPMYAVSQFIVFFWRANSITAFGLRQAQLSAVVLFALSLVVIALWVRFPNLNAGHPDEEADAAGTPEAEPAEAPPEKAAPTSGE
ncbi:MAG: prolipoprotein diacylglyceryl transferase [Candidatus Dormibacteraeota bacterium]|nr:prolipoprotein diacylglyceryl transferase [Candidatus Dormibacteraeota bacterium]